MKKVDIVNIFKDVKDYRMQGKIDYPLIEILVISVCAVLCGAEGYSDIAKFGEMKKDMFKQFLALENGIPTDDTFRIVFNCLKPKEFEKCFLKLISKMAKINNQIIPIDGKALRGANDAGETPIYVVSAWAKESGIVLASKKVRKKSNEITAIPEVLDMIDIKGCIVTIDAMGCQKKIVKKIVENGADYVISVKGNQGSTSEEAKDYFETCLKFGFDEEYDYYETIEKSHGRIEKRRYYVTEYIDYIHLKDKWANLKSIGMVHSIVEKNGKISEDKRYHISSLKADAKQYAECVRGHWSIENSCNWILDVVFKEDKSRIRKGYSAENMAVVRRIAMNILKTDTTLKGSTRLKFKQLSWDTDLVLPLLFKNDAETM